VIIAVFVVYYNFNYSVLQKSINENNQEIISLKHKLNRSNTLLLELKKLKTEAKKLKKKNLSLTEDLKYLNLLVKTSPVLHIEEKHFLEILRQILKKAVNSNIEASYKIEKNTDKYKTYEIEVNGEFSPTEFENFYKFIKNLESIGAIKEIRELKIDKNEKVEFEMKIVFWSFL
jgi:hypothetical protein